MTLRQNVGMSPIAMLAQGTRSRRFQTSGAMSIEVQIPEIKPPPRYQPVFPSAKHLMELGLSQFEIPHRLDVDRWTVGKPLRWLMETEWSYSPGSECYLRHTRRTAEESNLLEAKLFSTFLLAPKGTETHGHPRGNGEWRGWPGRQAPRPPSKGSRAMTEEILQTQGTRIKMKPGEYR
jgi:hypothetical protein